MPVIRLVNPRRRKAVKKARSRRRSKNPSLVLMGLNPHKGRSSMRHKKNARSHSRRRRRTVVHHNPKRRRRALARRRNRSTGAHRIRRRRNAYKMRHVRRRRMSRRRNPFGANYRTIGEMSLAAVIAGIGGTRHPGKDQRLERHEQWCYRLRSQHRQRSFGCLAAGKDAFAPKRRNRRTGGNGCASGRPHHQ